MLCNSLCIIPNSEIYSQYRPSVTKIRCLLKTELFLIRGQAISGDMHRGYDAFGNEGLDIGGGGMRKSRSFSIYLLKQGKDAGNSLKEDHNLDEGVVATNLPEGSQLYILDGVPREPWWKNYFGVSKKLHQVTKGALIFLPVGDRYFALSFGHVFHNLEDTAYEHDFGLRVTLNSVDPNRLKSTDILEPGADRRQRTQLPVDSDLTYFDFDHDSAILKSLTGKVKAKYTNLFRHATGASNLRISSSVSSGELSHLCAELLGLYENDQYKITFPGIQNITPVRDPILIGELNKNLLYAFRTKSEALNLAVPDIINYRDNVFATFSGCGACELYEDVFMGRYYEYLEAQKRDVASMGLDELKKHRLRLVDEDNSPYGDSFSILKCFVFDTALPSGAGTYNLTEGNWYEVAEDYIAKLQTYLDAKCVDLPLPIFNHDTEGEYNEDVAEKDATYLCFDRKNTSPKGQSQIEPCDLYAVRDGLSTFYHIKVSTFSAQLSHLFNQGINSIEILKMEEAAQTKLESLIDNAPISEAAKVQFKAPLADQNYSVVFGIVTHKDKAGKSLNLPLFSRISLMRNLKLLQLMSIPAEYGFIDDQRQPKPGRKKKRRTRNSTE